MGGMLQYLVCLSVCLSVCVYYHEIAVQAQYLHKLQVWNFARRWKSCFSTRQASLYRQEWLRLSINLKTRKINVQLQQWVLLNQTKGTIEYEIWNEEEITQEFREKCSSLKIWHCVLTLSVAIFLPDLYILPSILHSYRCYKVVVDLFWLSAAYQNIRPTFRPCSYNDTPATHS